MGVLLTTVFGLVVWVVLWALDYKAFDAIMITITLVVIAYVVRMIARYLPGNRRV